MNGRGPVKRFSSWDSTPPRPFAPRMPADIPPRLARLMIYYARVIARMPPEQAAQTMRAIEATIRPLDMRKEL